jgi:hypothetical protein
MIELKEGNIMRKFSFLLGSTVCLFLFTSTVYADASMRCGRDIISRGDNQGEVLIKCGEPIFVTERKIYRSGIPSSRVRSFSLSNGNYTDNIRGELIHHNRSVVEVPVEVWTFNIGRHHFMRELTFVNGRLTNINTLGYGR